MTKLVAVLLLTVTSMQALAQPNVRGYYESINKAELAIVAGNYPLAREYYAKAFRKSSVEGKDLYNSFVLTMLAYDTLDARHHLQFLAINGLKKEYIASNMEDINRKKLFEAISANYDADKAGRWNSGEEKLQLWVKELDELEYRDQHIRKITDNTDSLHKVDIANEQRLKAFIIKNGFPNFNTVGYFPNGSSPTSPNAVWYIMWHRRSSPTSLDGILKKAVLTGDIRPDYYAELLMGREEDYYCMLLANEPADTLKRNIIDKRRSEIYLESMEDYKKKLRYQFRYSAPFTFYNIQVLSWNWKFLSDEE